MSRILVVDDEPRIVAFLRRALSDEGFEVDGAFDGNDALMRLERSDYDLVLLDLMMPGLDGAGVLKALQEYQGQPEIMVLSARSDIPAKVVCLDLGAADYVTKPFALAELVARIRARLRSAAAGAIVRRAGVELDRSRHLVDVGDGPIKLPDREFLLLERLIQGDGEVCTREQLLNDVWGLAVDPGTNVVDVGVRRLRARLGSDRIETVRNVGYRFRAE
jgi:DNA-binding response OmpR family regulator